MRAFDRYFNLGYGEMSVVEAEAKNLTVCGIYECVHTDRQGLPSCWAQHQGEISAKYWRSPKPVSFNLPNFINIVMHIRRGDVGGPDDKVELKYNRDRFTPLAWYIEVLDRLKSCMAPRIRARLHIMAFSEGHPENFTILTRAHPDVVLKLNEDTLVTMHTMVTADVFVMAHSTFSHVAAMYNTEGFVVFNNYHIPPLPTWLVNDEKGDRMRPFCSQENQNYLFNKAWMRGGYSVDWVDVGRDRFSYFRAGNHSHRHALTGAHHGGSAQHHGDGGQHHGDATHHRDNASANQGRRALRG